MRVLVACEFSGIVRDAFRSRGHEAWSCDLFCESEREGPHIFDDVRKHLTAGWDLMIAHPPCTFLCSSGLHWNKRRPERQAGTEAALRFVAELLSAPIPRIALENPVGCISTRIRRPDQIIQPWMFGENASKRTCLWLKGLRKLQPTVIVPPKGWFWPVSPAEGVAIRHIDGVYFGCRDADPPHPVWSNQTPSGQNRLPPSPERWAERSRTYPGIAEAMAEQWDGCSVFGG